MPFDKEYAELSQQQRQAFKSQYERMGEADEPPFPLAGLRSLYEPMVKAQARANIEVRIVRTPGKAMTNFVAGVAFLTKFKPAVCRGAPCAMGFPVRVDFKLE